MVSPSSGDHLTKRKHAKHTEDDQMAMKKRDPDGVEVLLSEGANMTAAEPRLALL
ncbi:MAG: hypothetical protein AAF511_00235 [Pseudomonadota bacterium]